MIEIIARLFPVYSFLLSGFELLSIFKAALAAAMLVTFALALRKDAPAPWVLVCGVLVFFGTASRVRGQDSLWVESAVTCGRRRRCPSFARCMIGQGPGRRVTKLNGVTSGLCYAQIGR